MLRFVIVVAVALTATLPGVPAAGAECEAISQPTVLPDNIDGVRTKFKHNHDLRGLRFSIQPDLADLSLPDWYNALVGQGVNMAEVNFDPRKNLVSKPVASEAQLQAYIDATYLPAKSRSKEQNAAIKLFQDRIIPDRHYTPEEANTILIAFLSRLEALWKSGEIDDSIRFIIHQRLHFPPGGRKQADRRAEEFAADIGGFINAARAACLDHWISGIRIGENANPVMKEYLPIIADLAKRVNEKTDGWLKSRLFLANGGGMGAEFVGIDDPENGDPDFFKEISAETGSFAFGYKWMQLAGKEKLYINRRMKKDTCDGRACDSRSPDDWKIYLEENLGFADLRDFIESNKAAYPKHANVMFVGDSGDAIAGLVRRNKDGKLRPQAQLRALWGIWPDEPGWQGRLFLNAVADSDTNRTTRREGPDSGVAMFLTPGDGTAVTLPDTIKFWRNWPEPPPGERAAQ